MKICSSIYDLKLKMVDALCDEPFECSIIKVLTIVFGHVLYRYISNFKFDIRVEMNMSFTFVAVVME